MDGEISPDEVKDLLEDGADVRVVDIRDEQSFEYSRIPDSENIPFHELTSRVDELEGEEHIVTVCPHGKASVQAAQLIGSYEGTADATVESMEGGLDKYGMKFGLVGSEDDADESANAESPF
ncbi:rhodanese-like domain-containing protein [Haloterrigena alkaliphila]|uniref:Rhodanese-like domain-containing protein n=1 Tax=Haloterrigena alkaliphila TaxID=2816475 RepID=A0A8A2VJ74_9EURY|nr:rhodanese-like domain-containing protein [Haloterrigena alkaliphila]QSX00445.1 rhodanese-like domain-containing protein [Haloterrigena alkaliphila]